MKTKLQQAGRNSYGYVDITPGEDIARRLNCSKRTIQRYIKNGWLNRVGTGLVLTWKGHNII